MTPKPRLWPLYLILALNAAVFIKVGFFGSEARQNNVMPILMTLMLTALLVPIWFFFLSRLSWAVRKIGLMVFLALAIGMPVLFEIRELSGDFVPILAFRWSKSHGDLAEPLEKSAAPATIALQPGKHDFPRYLGPNGNNTLAGPVLAEDWATNPPKERWRIEIGAGWSSFAVQGKLAVTQEQRGDKEMVTCYNMDNGAFVWSHADENLFATTIGGDGPRATPNIYDGKVYTYGPTGLLNCLNLADGSLVWQKNAAEENQGTRPEWGYAASPLVYGDLVVVATGGQGRSLIAFNRHDSSKVWAAGDGKPGYATPRIQVLAGKEQIVNFYHNMLAGHDPETGAVLWQTPWGSGNATAANPLFLDGDRVLISSGYGAGAGLYRITGSGEGFSAEQQYLSPRLKAKFANYVQLDGYIYGLDEAVLTCVDPETGDRVWKRGRYGHGQMLLVGKLLLIQSEKGSLHLVEPNPEKHIELGKIPVLSGKAWNNMAISDNFLLMRNHKEAVCLELPVQSPGTFGALR
ncbi:MAG: PQQ-like beta-propeller repeat protein [Acidobacteriota bacterium]|nr:PQQ-like beta-propeller repeat protein [Acidobacteriota bacterium]